MTTQSVCPVCLKRLTASKKREGDRVFLEKTCPEHGSFRTLIWNGPPDYDSWNRNDPKVHLAHTHTRKDRGCPYDCGICPEHRQNTCCVLLEVTQRCNLSCPVCFASSGESQAEDPSVEEISQWYDLLMDSGGPFNIQLSGGEPTMRDDLPDLIRISKEKGFSFFQLNTNGLRRPQPDYSSTQGGRSTVYSAVRRFAGRYIPSPAGKALLRRSWPLSTCAKRSVLFWCPPSPAESTTARLAHC